MNSLEKRQYLPKISVYDLLVEKNKRKNENLKEILQKQLSKKTSANTVKRKSLNKNVNNKKETLNVLMQGSSVQNGTKEGKIIKDFLIERLKSDEEKWHEPLIVSDRPIEASIKLAVVPEIGTLNKSNFSNRPSKPLHESTLRPEYKEYLTKRLKEVKRMEYLEKMQQKELDSKLRQTISSHTDKRGKQSMFGMIEGGNDEDAVDDNEMGDSSGIMVRSIEEILKSLKQEAGVDNWSSESDKKIDELIKKILGEEEGIQESIEVDEEKIQEKPSSQLDEIAEVAEDNGEKTMGPNEMEVDDLLKELEKEQNEELSSRTMSQDTTKRKSSSKQHSVKFEEPIEYINDEVKVDISVIQGYQMKSYRKELASSTKELKEELHEIVPESKRTIHNLCGPNKLNDNVNSSSKMKNKWIGNYIPDKFPDKYIEYQKMIENELNEDDDEESLNERAKKAAERILKEKDDIEELEKMASNLLNNNYPAQYNREINPQIEVVGVPVNPGKPLQIHDFYSNVPPKLISTPIRVQQTLYPQYKPNREFEELGFDFKRMSILSARDKLSTTNRSESENTMQEYEDIEGAEIKERILHRRHGSVSNLIEVSEKPRRQRLSSAPNRHWLEEDSLIIRLEYQQIMREIELQKKEIRRNQTEVSVLPNDMDNKYDVAEEEEKEEELDQDSDLDKEVEFDENGQIISTTPIDSDHDRETQDQLNMKPTEAQLALEAAKSYVYYPPKRKRTNMKKSKKLIKRINEIEEFLNRQPNQLERSSSFNNLDKLKYSSIKKLPQDNEIITKTNSLEKLIDFNNWAEDNGYDYSQDARDWIEVIWDSWFDESYPPLPDNLDILSSSKQQQQQQQLQKQQTNITEKESLGKTENTTFMDVLELPERIEPIFEEIDEEFRDSVIETLQLEIQSLTKEIDGSETLNPFLYSRRGAIFRKLGYLLAAINDINKAIEHCPDLITAYWERHLLNLTANNIQAALDDLNVILKLDNKCVQAYKSRANVYAKLGDISLAISNLSQAARLIPDDIDIYQKRAELYEQTGNDRLALEDYNQLIKLQPQNIQAKLKHGQYYMKIEQWQLAIRDFSAVLRRVPTSLEARMARAKAYAQQQQWQEAICDYSAAIHISPNSPQPLLARGQLLRVAMPKQAIRDLSVSLLLDSSEDNLMAYFYRGILYAQTRQYREAIVDLEMVVCCNKDFTCAHVNLGIVYFEMGEYEKAVRYFTSGLLADATYVRAYICRAEAYFKLSQYDEAIKDICRAMHFNPDQPSLYMLRGEFHLAQGAMELAAICVKQAAEIGHNLGHSPVQQALVHSFLRNYSAAIDALLVATRTRPNVALLNLLGTTQMKAGRWKDAIHSFSVCLDNLRPTIKFKPWPQGAANIYFMMAQCYLEIKDFEKSQEAFRNTVKINPRHAQAYFQQGWCRLRLGKHKRGVLDLNKSLSIDPDLMGAYIARATLFGYRGQETKAILNCNEAIRIEPNSVRGYMYRAVLKYKIRSYSMALKDFNEAQKLDPNCSLVYFNRAVCLGAERRNLKHAIKDYSIVLIMPDMKELNLHMRAYRNRGNVYLSLGDIYNALQDFIADVKYEPTNMDLLMAVGFCYHKLGLLSEAVRIFSKCLDQHSFLLQARVSRANVLMDYLSVLGRRQALHDYQIALNIDPDYKPALVNLGYAKCADNKFKEAWDTFTKAIEVRKKTETIQDLVQIAAALDGRGVVCMQMKDLTGALKDLNHAITLLDSIGSKNNSLEVRDMKARLYLDRGVVHQLFNDGIRAVKDYNTAVLIGGNPDPTQGSKVLLSSTIARYNLSCIRLHQNQLDHALDTLVLCHQSCPGDEAVLANMAITKSLIKPTYTTTYTPEHIIELFDSAISLQPHSAYVYFNKAQYLNKIKRYKEAEKCYTKCLSILPDDPFYLKCRGDCRRQLGDREGAMEDFRLSIRISTALNRW